MKTKVAVCLAVFGIVCARAQTAAPGTASPPPTAGVGQTPPSATPPRPDGVGAATNAAAGAPGRATNAAAQPTVEPWPSTPIINVPANPGEPMRDQALNPTDANLLRQIRQSVFSAGQPGSESVHFVLMNGAVRVTGSVPTAEEQKRIDTALSQIPGVTKVYDALAVAGGTTARAPISAASTNANAAPPTPALPPTGRTGSSGSTNASGTP